MSRTEDFKTLAVAARAMADLADGQKDTVDWWTKFGIATQDFMRIFTAVQPKNDRHKRAAESAAIARGVELADGRPIMADGSHARA
jgi:hypothetical protein